jgi:hypothetical protein
VSARFVPQPGPARVVAGTVVVAVVMGTLGWVVGANVQSPADAAAAHRAPPAALITVPVEKRALTADVVGQGTLEFGARRELTLTGAVAVVADGGEGTTQLVTKAPSSGRTVREGDVLMEVSGRPVFVLKGSVPMYRKVVPGSTGDDVRQLRASMRRLMPARGLSVTGPFSAGVAAAVKAWYAEKGYSATQPSTEERTRLRELEHAVADAPKGQARTDAVSDLAVFRRTYGLSVASGEVLFLPRLPVRVDKASVTAGGPAAGKVATVTDSVLVVNGAVQLGDEELLHKGMKATLQTLTGAKFRADLTGLGASVAPPPKAAAPQQTSEGQNGGDPPAEESTEIAGTPIRLKPKPAKKLVGYAGESVKVVIRVGSTRGSVLTVPTAAVFTSADGRPRVRVQNTADPATAKDVPIRTGLSTDGYVQITPVDGAALATGDRVVVGRS